MGGYIGARSGTISATVANVQDVTATDTTPEITLKNTTEEDIDGGREGTVTFKGERSGGEEVTLAQIEGSHHLTNDDNRGQLVFKTNNNQLGDNVTEAKMTIDSVGDVNVTSGAPSLTITNTTHEDTDGGREGKLKFQGEQSGGELSTLAEIQASHDGTADDEKGELILRVNDGNDGSSPSEVMRINSLGNVGIGTADIDVSTQAGGSGYKALQIESDEGGQINFDHNDAGTGSTLGQLNFQRAGEVVAEIEGVTDGATDSGRLVFRTQPNGGALTERMRIDHDGYITMPQTPMFSYLGSRTHTVGTGDLVWSTANVWSSAVNHSMNNGSHFNPANGRFTAPITGLYHFQIQAQVYGHSSGYFYTYLDYNQNVRSYIQISQGNNYWLSTHHIYINLNANDFVNASSTNNYSGSQILYPGFSGALVG